jgi:hypothetical protein
MIDVNKGITQVCEGGSPPPALYSLKNPQCIFLNFGDNNLIKINNGLKITLSGLVSLLWKLDK